MKQSFIPNRSARIVVAGISVVAGIFLCLAPRANGNGTEDPSPALVALGQHLFNDAQLSADGSVSCASCHIAAKAFSDGLPVAIGVDRRAGTRNTPSLENIALSSNATFFWDGRRNSLDQAVMDPLTNPVEMGLPNGTILLEKLQNDQDFRSALPRTAVSNREQLAFAARALSAYVHTVTQRTSAYDRYASGEDSKALSPMAQRGLNVFTEKGQCAQCHQMRSTPATFTDQAFHHTGVGLDSVANDLPQLTQNTITRSLQGADLGNRIATHSDEAQLGRFNVTHDVADIGLFRTPSLRDVAMTAPYMHDGSAPTLEAALDQEIYYRGLSSGHPIGLTVAEKNELLAFLREL